MPGSGNTGGGRNPAAYEFKVLNRWTEFLRRPEARGHAVQIYTELDELAESVVTFLASGFDAGAPALVVATPEHRERFAAALAARGWDAERLSCEGLLHFADAAASLTEIMDGNRPSPRAFARVVGGLIDELAQRHPGHEVRVFGEMVDLLVERRQAGAAFALEQFWNVLALRHDFSLLCAYRLDVFDQKTQAATLPQICRTHSHVLPATDPARFARAVDGALEDVLGPAQAGKVYVVAGDELRKNRVPPAQIVLMWVSTNMPALADRILASARRRYLASA
jgi:hypothetical protein